MMDGSERLPSRVALCRWLRAFETEESISVLAVGNPDQLKATLAGGADSFVARGAAAVAMLRELEALENPCRGPGSAVPAGSGPAVGAGAVPDS
jgi:hypothetical protein